MLSFISHQKKNAKLEAQQAVERWKYWEKTVSREYQHLPTCHTNAWSAADLFYNQSGWEEEEGVKASKDIWTDSDEEECILQDTYNDFFTTLAHGQ